MTTGLLEPPYGDRDAGGMAARIDAIPEQIGAALDAGVTRPWRPPVTDPDLLAVGALGGSAITADLVAGLYGDTLLRPLIPVREYQWPACVGPRSLALLASYSGNTEETLALYEEAGRRAIPRLALTTGGTLAEYCQRDGVPWARLPAGSPPRAAMYGSWVRLTQLLHALEWNPGPDPDWREARARLAERRELLGTRTAEADNPAKQMARDLHGRPLFLYAGSARLAGLATRIRNQINENAKLLAHSALVPELNHNEIVGWEAPAAWNRNAAVLLLHDPEDPAEVRTRLALTAEYVRGRGAEVFELEEREGTRITRAAALAQFGDYLSLYLALLGGVDPTPIASIDWFKSRLAQSRKR